MIKKILLALFFRYERYLVWSHKFQHVIEETEDGDKTYIMFYLKIWFYPNRVNKYYTDAICSSNKYRPESHEEYGKMVEQLKKFHNQQLMTKFGYEKIKNVKNLENELREAIDKEDYMLAKHLEEVLKRHKNENV